MRRSRILALPIALVGVVTLVAAPALSRANQATPDAPPDVVTETQARGPLADHPGQALLQLRVTLAPGAV